MNKKDNEFINAAVNEAIVILSKYRQKLFTVGVLARMFGKGRTTIHERKQLHWDKYNLPNRSGDK